MEGLCIEPQRSLKVDLLQVTDGKEYKESPYEDILRIDQEEIEINLAACIPEYKQSTMDSVQRRFGETKMFNSSLLLIFLNTVTIKPLHN